MSWVLDLLGRVAADVWSTLAAEWPFRCCPSSPRPRFRFTWELTGSAPGCRSGAGGHRRRRAARDADPVLLVRDDGDRARHARDPHALGADRRLHGRLPADQPRGAFPQRRAVRLDVRTDLLRRHHRAGPCRRGGNRSARAHRLAGRGPHAPCGMPARLLPGTCPLPGPERASREHYHRLWPSARGSRRGLRLAELGRELARTGPPVGRCWFLGYSALGYLVIELLPTGFLTGMLSGHSPASIALAAVLGSACLHHHRGIPPDGGRACARRPRPRAGDGLPGHRGRNQHRRDHRKPSSSPAPASSPSSWRLLFAGALALGVPDRRHPQLTRLRFAFLCTRSDCAASTRRRAAVSHTVRQTSTHTVRGTHPGTPRSGRAALPHPAGHRRRSAQVRCSRYRHQGRRGHGLTACGLPPHRAIRCRRGFCPQAAKVRDRHPGNGLCRAGGCPSL